MEMLDFFEYLETCTQSLETSRFISVSVCYLLKDIPNLIKESQHKIPSLFILSDLVGKTEWEKARGDMISDYVSDLSSQLNDVLYGETEDKMVKLFISCYKQ